MPDYKTLNGRVATQEEADAREVVFFVPDGNSEPYSFDKALPLLARTVLQGEQDGFPPPGTEIEIIQAELVDGKDVVLGFLYGENVGICMLQDVALLESKAAEGDVTASGSTGGG